MRAVVESIIELTLVLLLIGGWLGDRFQVVSGSMSPTLLGPHRTFHCSACGQRNDLPSDVPNIPGRVAYCSGCRAQGPVIDSLSEASGDGLLVDRRAFYLSPPRRWEVIAFRLPHEASRIAVKRVIGLPGETIELRFGKFSADGKPLEPPDAVFAIPPDYTPPPSYRGPLTWTLGPDEYFVAGDNAAISDDSRLWPAGPGVATQLIVGKPIVVHYPVRNATWRGLPFHVPDVSSIRYIR